ncbi:HEAT repeat domain-containing protein [Thiohalomonas denitrificans]|uniref:Negative regulator of GroEL, contains thioredoxin-like and TPR-like domains n=1 Tax=Thiohalomonas denitrificans TaxID=415747 RepID=A0A1G5PQL0_9GAMM|nr:HEAT repeat domain-containing protein [Thiohalomonas denitrificans]SCZ51707.1 Negative regulator of GroEL, contains thioredoxin-like and TPR-like domains [Thiohalomonas denitrificans]
MSQVPDALLFIAPGCPHCPGVLQGLSDLVKSGEIGRLEVINVAVHPEKAAEMGVRSAPWTRIGPFILEGAQTPGALKQWAEKALGGEAGSEYLHELLSSGRFSEAEAYLEAEPQRLVETLAIVGDPEAPMQVRLGANALLENREGSEALTALVPRLGELSRHEDHRIRSDACHLLGLSGSPEAAAYLRERLQDDSAEVKEIAEESLEKLGG